MAPHVLGHPQPDQNGTSIEKQEALDAVLCFCQSGEFQFLGNFPNVYSSSSLQLAELFYGLSEGVLYILQILFSPRHRLLDSVDHDELARGFSHAVMAQVIINYFSKLANTINNKY